MSADLSDRYSRLRRSRVLPAPLSLSLSHARLSERRQKRSLSSLIGGRQLIFKFISFHGKQRAFSVRLPELNTWQLASQQKLTAFAF